MFLPLELVDRENGTPMQKNGGGVRIASRSTLEDIVGYASYITQYFRFATRGSAATLSSIVVLPPSCDSTRILSCTPS